MLYFFPQSCRSDGTCCRLTAFSQQPLVQRHNQAWSHHSDLHSLYNWNKICCGYSQQTVPASLQSDTARFMLPVPADRPVLGQQFPTFSSFACSWSSTKHSSKKALILSTMMCTAPSSMCNYLCRCLKKKINSNRVM